MTHHSLHHFETFLCVAENGGFTAAANKMGVSAETGQNPLEELYSAFGSVIRDEDYVAAASSHKGLNSGHLDFLTFGKNEPALHHYHNTYRDALGLQKLPLIKV